jgi:hypothetical protein
LSGCAYDVVRDVPGKDVVIKVLGYPGSAERISLVGDGRAYRKATLDGREIPELLRDKSVEVRFPGERLRQPWHRKLAGLQPGPVPQDAESLYEASCYAADNNALEVRSLYRSGPTKVPQVQKARDAFFTQPVFIERGVWDKNLFDGDMTTEFNVNNRLRDFKGGALRVDFGRPIRIETLAVILKDSLAVQAYFAGGEPLAETSTDLRAWSPAKVTASENVLTIAAAADAEVRYVRLLNAPVKVLEIEGLFQGKRLDRSKWRASNLFGWYGKNPAVKSWSGSFVLDEAAKGSYLAIPLEGRHGREGAFAALRVGGRLVGAPDRSVSYPTNVWEFRVEPKAENYTYYVPVTPEMIGQKIEVVVLGLNKDMLDFKPEAWITAYPIPFESRELVLQRAKTE